MIISLDAHPNHDDPVGSWTEMMMPGKARTMVQVVNGVPAVRALRRIEDPGRRRERGEDPQKGSS